MKVLLASSGWRPSVLLHIPEGTESSNKGASGPKRRVVLRPRRACPLWGRPQREIPAPASCLGVLCLATGLASLLRLLQRLKPLSSVPFGSGQVSPAGFTVGHAGHPLELMGFLIYRHRASVFI